MAGLISYVKKAFKNYPDTTTRLSAENLNHLDNGIFDLDQAVGNALGTTDISSVGDGTIKGAISILNTSTNQLNNDLINLRSMLMANLDFNNAVNVTVNFTAPFDGVLFGAARTTANAAQHLLINGKNAAFIPASGSTPAYVNLDIRGIEAGSVFSGVSGYATDFVPIFVPYKTN